MKDYILIGFLIISTILVIIIRIYAPTIKGKLGEWLVASQLNKLDKENYRVINDIILKTDRGTSQIDHIVVGPHGIIAIETKYYKGWIFGSEDSINWTQVIFKNKYKFYNPIIQNKGHIKAIDENLKEYARMQYHSIIVLAGSGSFKNFEKITTKVIYTKDLYKTILELSSPQILSSDEINKISNELVEKSYNDKKTRKEHRKSIQSNRINHDKMISTNTCPKCGGVLVVKNGKLGSFLACSSYPRCRFTQNL